MGNKLKVVAEILKGVEAEVNGQVLKEVLKHDSADEYQVLLGEEPGQPCQALVVAGARTVRVDPADQVVGAIQLEARPLGGRSPTPPLSPRRSPSPIYSPTSNDGSSSDSKSGEKHPRRIKDKPKPDPKPVI